MLFCVFLHVQRSKNWISRISTNEWIASLMRMREILSNFLIHDKIKRSLKKEESFL